MRAYFFIFFKFFKFFIFNYNILLPSITRVFRNNYFFKSTYFYKKLNLNMFFYKYNVLLLRNSRYFMGFSTTLINLKKLRFRTEMKGLVLLKKNLSNSLTSHFPVSISEKKGNVKWSRRIFSTTLVHLSNWAKIYRKSVVFSKINFFTNSTLSLDNYFFRKVKERELLDYKRLTISPLEEIQESELNESEYSGRIFMFESFFLNFGFTFEDFFDFLVTGVPKSSWRLANSISIFDGLSDGMFKGSAHGSMSGVLMFKLSKKTLNAGLRAKGLEDFSKAIEAFKDISVIDDSYFLENKNPLLGDSFSKFKSNLAELEKIRITQAELLKKEFYEFYDINIYVKRSASSIKNVIARKLHVDILNKLNTNICRLEENSSFYEKFKYNSSKQIIFPKKKVFSKKLSAGSFFEGFGFFKFKGRHIGSLDGFSKSEFNGTVCGKFSGKCKGKLKGLFLGTYRSKTKTWVFDKFTEFTEFVSGVFSGVFDGNFEGKGKGVFDGKFNGSLVGFGNGSTDGRLYGVAEGEFSGIVCGKFFGKVDGVITGKFKGYTTAESGRYDFFDDCDFFNNAISQNLNFDNVVKDADGKTELENYHDWEEFFFSELTNVTSFSFVDSLHFFLSKVFITGSLTLKYKKFGFFLNFFYFNSYINNFFLKNEEPESEFPTIRSIGYIDPVQLDKNKHNLNIIFNDININTDESAIKLYYTFKVNSCLISHKNKKFKVELFRFNLIFAIL